MLRIIIYNNADIRTPWISLANVVLPGDKRALYADGYRRYNSTLN